MKTVLAVIPLTLLTCLRVHAQGTVSFKNLNSNPVINAPVILSDGVTKASGPQYMAALLAGQSANNLYPIATTPFLTGGAAGYFAGGVQSIPFVPGGGIAFIQLEFWNATAFNTWQVAQASGLPNAWGQSFIFPVVTGDPNATPPATPAFLTGLGTSPIFLTLIPEPSSFVLAGLGLAIFALRRVAMRLPPRITIFYLPVRSSAAARHGIARKT